jgi:hypothetical protein
MKVFLVIVAFILVVCFFFLYITGKGGESKIYCRLFNKDEWFGWEKVIENFDSVHYIEHYEYDFNPTINNRKFSLTVDGTECQIIYWDATDSISVHDFPGVENGCLCGFDKYHANLVKNMLTEKFGLE